MPTPTANDFAAELLRQLVAEAVEEAASRPPLLATSKGLEAHVQWRVAPWWAVLGYAQRPWGAPFDR